ncbi:MAG: hypothetical protein WBC04_07070 [Candidatus Acidiferrales bacterium]
MSRRKLWILFSLAVLLRLAGPGISMLMLAGSDEDVSNNNEIAVCAVCIRSASPQASLVPATLGERTELAFRRLVSGMSPKEFSSTGFSAPLGQDLLHLLGVQRK